MITADEMRKLELDAESGGITTLQLMENAGKGAAETLAHEQDLVGKKILVLAYHGNNGGDGFVMTRYLQEYCETHVWFVGDSKKLTGAALANHDRLDKNSFVKGADFSEYNVIIDALLGTGTKGLLKEPLKTLARAWNQSKAFKVALDVPTGIDPDNGDHDLYFHSDIILTFHDTKPGIVQFMNHVRVVDIGLNS
ncbi:MAG: NAD(P)H-hydrate epimerase [Candidatus Woesearchaeota archaeon]